MSVGPRSVITRVIELDLPRPRDLADTKVARLFGEIEDLLTPDLIRLDEQLEAH